MRRRGKIRVAALVAWAILLLPQMAWAQRVLLVRLPGPDAVLSEAFTRLRAELTLEGFEVYLVEPDASIDSPEALAQLAAREGALAAISLTHHVDAPAAELSIADRVTGKISLRTLELHEGPEAPSVLAVRAADLLRSSLRELEPGQRPPPDVVGADTKPPPAVVQRFASAPMARFRVDTGAAALGIGLKTGPGYAPRLSLTYRLTDRFDVGAQLAGPALGALYRTPDEGSATVIQALGLVRGSFAFVRRGAFEAYVLAAAGVYYLQAKGNVSIPFSSETQSDTSFAGGAGLGVDIRFPPRIVLSVEASALGLAPRVAVALLDNTYTFFEPFVVATAAFGVEF